MNCTWSMKGLPWKHKTHKIRKILENFCKESIFWWNYRPSCAILLKMDLLIDNFHKFCIIFQKTYYKKLRGSVLNFYQSLFQSPFRKRTLYYIETSRIICIENWLVASWQVHICFYSKISLSRPLMQLKRSK